jgi:hypothetical protein
MQNSSSNSSNNDEAKEKKHATTAKRYNSNSSAKKKKKKKHKAKQAEPASQQQQRTNLVVPSLLQLGLLHLATPRVLLRNPRALALIPEELAEEVLVLIVKRGQLTIPIVHAFNASGHPQLVQWLAKHVDVFHAIAPAPSAGCRPFRP